MGITSQETRELALAAYEAGNVTLGHIAKIFNVHRTTLYRWILAYRQYRRTSPLSSGNRRAAYTDLDAKKLDAFVEQHPDATLEDIRDATGKTCSIMSVHRALRRLGWVYKKNRYERVSKIGQT